MSLSLWRKPCPSTAPHREETARRGFFTTGTSYLGQISLPVPYDSAAPLRSAGEFKRQAAKREPIQLSWAASLVSVAAASSGPNREDEGIQVLQMATEVDTGFTAEFLPLLWWLAGMLYQGMASNEFHNNNYPESIKNYGLAAAKLLRSEIAGTSGRDARRRSRSGNARAGPCGLLRSRVRRSHTRTGKARGPFRRTPSQQLVSAICADDSSGRPREYGSAHALDGCSQGRRICWCAAVRRAVAWIHSDESRGLLSRIDRMRATTGASDRVPPRSAD